MSSGVDVAEPQPSPSPNRVAPSRSNWTQSPVASVPKDPTRTASTSPGVAASVDGEDSTKTASSSLTEPQGPSNLHVAYAHGTPASLHTGAKKATGASASRMNMSDSVSGARG